jgi:predicted O-methyltransferase YrrM
MNLSGFFKTKTAELSAEQKEQAEAENFLSKNVRHYLPAYLLSLDDEPFQPSARLIEIALEASRIAFSMDLSPVAKPFYKELQVFMNTYPGEHYRLLAALMQVLQPKTVIEIGTYQGAGCMAMKHTLPVGSRLYTYDIIPFDQIPGCGLTASDFDQQMEQRIVDLADPKQAESQMDILENADFIFADAAKDGVMERKFIALFDRVKFKKPPIIMFDDIRFVNMTQIWREIRHPKLDVSSFGHWSGTGLVEWV